MINQVSLALGSALCALLLVIVFFLQKQSRTTTSKIYRNLIYSSLYASFGIYILFLFINSISQNEFIYFLLTKLYWVNGFFFFFNYYMYIVAFSCGNKNITFRNIMKIKLSKVVVGIGTAFLIAFIISPGSIYNEDGIILILSAPVMFMLLCGGFIVTLSLIYAHKHRNTNPVAIRKIILYSFAFMTLTCLAQFSIPTMLFITVAMVCLLYVLYFICENPDLYVIDDLNKLQEQVETSKKSKTDILANMSKEINNPINSIANNAQNIINNDLTVEENKKILKEISNDGNNLIEIIDHILDISTLENGKDSINENEYSIGSIIKELENNYKFKISKKQIDFKINIAPNIPNVLYGDSSKVKQILNNIISNSIKYTDYGRIQIDIKCDTAGSLTNLHIIIADTGVGIKNEDKENIFNRTNESEEASGLGLAITKLYVDQLNGTINFDSTYLAGTIFYIDLPQEVRDSSPIVLEEATSTNEIVYKDYNKQRIIIVDEDNLNRKVLIKLLENYNFEVDQAESGIECLNKIKRGNVYDLILIDHQMAGLDGIEVLNALNKLKQFFEVPPVVMTTANAASGKRDFYLNCGFDEYIAKPISILDLNKVIKKLVKVKTSRGYEVSEINIDNEIQDHKKEGKNVKNNDPLYSNDFSSAVEIPIENNNIMEEINIPEITEEDNGPFVELTKAEKREMEADIPKTIKLHDLSEDRNENK